MSLYKQLLLSTFAILLCLCSALWIGELKRTRDYLTLQMTTETQESANFLGLSLSTVQGGSERPIMQTMVDALFDSGTYRLIEVRDLEGRVLVARSIDEVSLLPVPAWFRRTVELSIPQASAKIMQGWVQTATVRIENQTDIAYLNLWGGAKNTAIWCGVAWLVFTALGGLVLRSILLPLKRIEEQATALCERQIDIRQEVPKTRELRRVVEAMNVMTARIAQIFREHAAIADRLNQEVYQDPLTGLGNRRYLESQFAARSADAEHRLLGSFVLLQLQSLKELNEQCGYQQGDRVLQELARRVREGCQKISDSLLARLGGGDLALLLPGTDALQVRTLWEEELVPAYGGSSHDLGDVLQSVSLIGGAVSFEQAASLQELLAAADMALAKARTAGGCNLQIVSLGRAGELSMQGRMHWKETILELIAEKNIVFYSQPTVEKGNTQLPFAQEVFTRVVDSSGAHVSLGMYLAVAEQFGLTADLEQMIVEKLLQLPLQQLFAQPITLNISPSSLADPSFFSWICEQLVKCGNTGLHFTLELPETSLTTHGGLVKDFAAAVKTAGHGIGVDHFGQGGTGLTYLQWLMPDYVKLDRAITDDLLRQNHEVGFFINALCSVAHSIGVKVIMKNVETVQQVEMLSPLNIDALQGNALQEPVLVEPA
nr:EAL domain-containing protein [uncultured Desulfobulbus sp.]